MSTTITMITMQKKKQIMKIKVIKQDDGELTMNDMLFRAFLSNAIIFLKAVVLVGGFLQ